VKKTNQMKQHSFSFCAGTVKIRKRAILAVDITENLSIFVHLNRHSIIKLLLLLTKKEFSKHSNIVITLNQSFFPSIRAVSLDVQSSSFQKITFSYTNSKNEQTDKITSIVDNLDWTPFSSVSNDRFSIDTFTSPSNLTLRKITDTLS
jgi:hypothetical protein